MKSFKIPLVKVIGLLALAALLVAGCSDTPEEPAANIAPNTFITSYNIAISPDSGSFYNTTVYWRPSDPDGVALRFRYWLMDNMDSTLVMDSTFDTSISLSIEFPTGTEEYYFYVQTQDNAGMYDPTPAEIDIAITSVRSLDQFKPDTRLVEGPADGSLAGTGIHVTFSGSDIDGYVETFQYMTDEDTVWSSVANDVVAGGATLDILGMSTGARTLIVRSVDNFGQIDPSPVSISFVVTDTLHPDLYVISGAIEGAFFFLPAGGTEADVETGWSGDAAWYYSTLEYRYRVDGGVWSDWQTESSAMLTGLPAGSHVLDVEAMDLGGNTSTYTTHFGVGSLTGDLGVLVVNGISFADYEDEAWNFWNAMDFMTTYDVDFWDVFDGEDYSNTPGLPARLVGTGAIPGETIGQYSSCVMVMNEYNSSGTSDLAIYQGMLPLLVSYLNAGGNLLIASRYSSDFITGGVLTYAQVSYGESGVTISGLTAAVSNMVDIDPIGSLAGTDLPDIPTSSEVTVLFTVPDYPDNIGGFITEPAGSGKLALISGRPYRMNLTAVNTNYSAILSDYFGEQ